MSLLGKTPEPQARKWGEVVTTLALGITLGFIVLIFNFAAERPPVIAVIFGLLIFLVSRVILPWYRGKSDF